MNYLQFKSNPALRKKACRVIEKIADPLFESFDLTFFSYKLSQGDKFIFLTNNYAWLNNCAKKGYIHYLPTYQPDHDFFLWDAVERDNPVQKIIEDARQNFNIAHGCTIIKCVGDVEEHFNFGTTKMHPEMNNFYIKNREILERFIIYFKHKANKIIEMALDQPVDLKELGLIKNALKKHEFYREIDYFIEQTQVKTIQVVLDDESIITLNLTLAHTGYFLLQGLSYKQIASEMYVTEKAIEARVAKLRQMTNTNNKKELIDCLNQTNFRKTLDLALMDSSRHKRIKRGWIRRHVG